MLAVHIPINNNVAIKVINANLGFPNSFSKNFSIIYISMIHQDLVNDNYEMNNPNPLFLQKRLYHS